MSRWLSPWTPEPWQGHGLAFESHSSNVNFVITIYHYTIYHYFSTVMPNPLICWIRSTNNSESMWTDKKGKKMLPIYFVQSTSRLNTESKVIQNWQNNCSDV